MSITPKQFEQMQARLGGPKRRPAPVFETSVRTASSKNQIVIGVDPSLRGTGYGVIQAAQRSARALAHGTIVCPAGWERSRCLAKIAQTLREVVARHKPTACASEGLFYAQNLQTALIMGEARDAGPGGAGRGGVGNFRDRPAQGQASDRRFRSGAKNGRRQNGAAPPAIARTALAGSLAKQNIVIRIGIERRVQINEVNARVGKKLLVAQPLEIVAKQQTVHLRALYRRGLPSARKKRDGVS